MRIVARQIWWLHVIRITIGCAIIMLGVLTPWPGAIQGFQHNDWRSLKVLIPAGIAFVTAGILFAAYSYLEWQPRGFAVGITRHGLILKANGLRCPKLVVIKWTQVRGAKYDPPVLPFGVGRVSIYLHDYLPKGRLPTERGGVVELGPYTVGLQGRWELWHPEDVASQINLAAQDPEARKAL